MGAAEALTIAAWVLGAAMLFGTALAADCTGKPNGLSPDPTDCTCFFNCANGAGARQCCGTGTCFDPVILGCNFCANVPSCNKPPPPPVATRSPSPPPSTKPPPPKASPSPPPVARLPPSPPPVAGGCTKFYTVKSGDTCFAIWTANGLPSATFYALNPGINCNNLQIGQQVCIGGGVASPSPPPVAKPPPPSVAKPPPPSVKRPPPPTVKRPPPPPVKRPPPPPVKRPPPPPVKRPPPPPVNRPPPPPVKRPPPPPVKRPPPPPVKRPPPPPVKRPPPPPVKRPPPPPVKRPPPPPVAKPPPPSPPPSGCTKYWTVVSGDTCFAIWTTNGLPSATFYALNPGINCDNLQIGQQVCIAGGTGPTPSPSPPPPVAKPPPPALLPPSPPPVAGVCTKFYTVVSGDTCFAIWTANGLPSATFYALNPGINCDNLQIGQQVCVAGGGGPTPSPSPPPPLGANPSPPPPTSGSNNRVFAYWGQGDGSTFNEPSLGNACSNYPYDFIMVAFVPSFGDLGGPFIDVTQTSAVNLAFHSVAATGPDVPRCQALGKKVILSIGGAAGVYGFRSAAAAVQTATAFWNGYLGGSGTNRPFGNGVVFDGIDLDLEGGSPNYYSDFALALKQLYTGASKKYYLTAVPQCPFPDAFTGPALQTAGQAFDFVLIQFYNNFCGGSQSRIVTSFNSDWAPLATSKGFKLVVTLPASANAAGSGYLDSSTAASTINALKSSPTLAGFGFWSVAYDFANKINGQTWSQRVKALI